MLFGKKNKNEKIDTDYFNQKFPGNDASKIDTEPISETDVPKSYTINAPVPTEEEIKLREKTIENQLFQLGYRSAANMNHDNMNQDIEPKIIHENDVELTGKKYQYHNTIYFYHIRYENKSFHLNTFDSGFLEMSVPDNELCFMDILEELNIAKKAMIKKIEAEFLGIKISLDDIELYSLEKIIEGRYEK